MYKEYKSANSLFLLGLGERRIIDDVYYISPIDTTASTFRLIDNTTLILGSSYNHIKFLIFSDLIDMSSITKIDAASNLIRKNEANLVDTSSCAPNSSVQRKDVYFISETTSAIASDRLIYTPISNGETFVAVAYSSTHVFCATNIGIHVVVLSDNSFLANINLSGITSIAANFYGLYIGTNLGVYYITYADLLVAGDRTAFISLKYNTLSNPAIQSDSVTALSALATDIALGIGSSSGLDFIPDTNVSTAYSLSSISITSVAVNSTQLAYVDNASAYVRAKPAANFISENDYLAGARNSFVADITPKLSGLPTSDFSFSRDGKMASIKSVSTVGGIDFYSIDAAGDFTFEGTFDFIAYAQTQYTLNDQYDWGSCQYEIFGNHIKSNGYVTETGGYYYLVLELDTTAASWSVADFKSPHGAFSSTFSNRNYGSGPCSFGYRLWAVGIRIDNVSYFTYDTYLVNGTSVIKKDFYTDTSVYSAIIGINPDGNYLIGFNRYADSIDYINTSGSHDFSYSINLSINQVLLPTCRIDDKLVLYVNDADSNKYLILLQLNNTDIVELDRLAISDYAYLYYFDDTLICRGQFDLYKYKIIDDKLLPYNGTFFHLEDTWLDEYYDVHNMCNDKVYFYKRTQISADPILYEYTYYYGLLDPSREQDYTTATAVSLGLEMISVDTDQGPILEELAYPAVYTKLAPSLTSDQMKYPTIKTHAEITLTRAVGSLAYMVESGTNYEYKLYNFFEDKTVNGIRNVFSSPKEPWIISQENYGYSEKLFSSVKVPDGISLDNSVEISYKVSGAFVSTTPKVKVSGLFLEIVNSISVELTFVNDMSSEFSFYILGTLYSYTPSDTDTYADVLAFFVAALKTRKYDCRAVDNGIVLNDLYGLFSTGLTSTRSPVIKYKQAGSYISI